MRKTLVLVVIILLVSGAVALASWQVVDWVKGDSEAQEAGNVATADAAGEGSGESGTVPAEEGVEAAAAGEGGEAGVPVNSDAMEYDDPDQRYVTETQRHQNFFQALAEGKVSRLDVTATDFQPVGDQNTSYVYFVVATTDNARSDGMFVMKFEGGMWRIGAVRQLSGDLGGGTNYMAPSSFEDDLAREIEELQEFLTKVAEGRLAYLTVDSVNQVGACEVVLNGKVGSKGGKVYPAEMQLRKDYNIWHLTNVVCL